MKRQRHSHASLIFSAGKGKYVPILTNLKGKTLTQNIENVKCISY